MTKEEQYLADSDPQLSVIIQTVPHPTINSTHDVFYDLMSCLVEQQIHYRSTKKIFAKMLQQADLEWLTVENFGVFEEKGLGRAKLSMAKYESLLSAVAFFQAAPIQWEALTDDEVRAHLSGIKGVGKWTVDMILLYTLERPCVFPADDFHLKQVMTDLYGLDANSKLKAQMLEVAQHWGNCQSLAVKYLLAWKEYQKKNRP